MCLSFPSHVVHASFFGFMWLSLIVVRIAYKENKHLEDRSNNMCDLCSHNCVRTDMVQYLEFSTLFNEHNF